MFGLDKRTHGDVQMLAERLARQEIPDNANDFEDSTKPDGRQGLFGQGSLGFSAYARARDAGVLPEKGKNGTTSEILSSDGNVVSFAKELYDRIPPSDRSEREYQIILDRQGRIVTALRGDSSSVRTVMNSRDQKFGGSPYPDLARVRRIQMTAGGMQVHNHPHGKDGSAARELGFGLSGGDVGSAIQRMEAGGVAVTKEGAYVIRNPKWREDFDQLQATMRTARADTARRAVEDLRKGVPRSAVRLAARNALDDAATKALQDTRARGNAFGKRIDGLVEETALRLKSAGRIENVRFAQMTSAESRIFAQTYHAAVKEVAARAGLEIDFIPNAGYEDIR